MHGAAGHIMDEALGTQPISAQKVLRVGLVTPLGHGGKGGIDRLNDAITEEIAARPDYALRVRQIVTRGDGNLFWGAFLFAAALVQTNWLCARREVDLLHIHLSNRGSAYRKMMIGAIARFWRTPYVVHLHGVDYETFWDSLSPPLSSALANLFRYSAGAIVMGEYWAGVVAARAPQMRGRLTIIANATAAAQNAPVASADGRLRVTFLGKIGERKGVPVLIDALAQLVERDDWRAVIAGDGEVEACRQSLKAHGLEERVATPGWLDVSSRDALLAGTDILVLPSRAENLPMVIIEAMARGLAVVATPVGAIPEVIEDGRNGMLTPVGDAKALANALTRLIEDADLRRACGAAAREDHKRLYDISAYMRRINAVWRGAAS